jgi:hypothetical protein
MYTNKVDEEEHEVANELTEENANWQTKHLTHTDEREIG